MIESEGRWELVETAIRIENSLAVIYKRVSKKKEVARRYAIEYGDAMTNLPSWSPEERDEWSRAVNLAKSGIFDPLTDLIEDQATKFIQTSKDHPAQKRFIDKVRGVPSRKIGKGLKNLAKSL